MPNWVATKVEVTGPDHVIKAWIDQSLQGYTVKPGDPAAAKARSLGLVDAGEFRKGEFSFGAVTGVPDSYADNWYDDAISLWGTKWDVSGVDVEDLKSEFEQARETNSDQIGVREITVCLSFDTAWSPAIPYFEAVVDKYPELTVRSTFIDEGWNFVGWSKTDRDGTVGEMLDHEDVLPALPSMTEGGEDEWFDAHELRLEAIETELNRRAAEA